jgi:hypothetical protein
MRGEPKRQSGTRRARSAVQERLVDGGGEIPAVRPEAASRVYGRTIFTAEQEKIVGGITAAASTLRALSEGAKADHSVPKYTSRAHLAASNRR